MLHKILQKLPRENEALGRVEIAAHPLGKNFHIRDDFRGAMQHVVHQDRRIRQNHALHGAVRNVAFVPQRDIFQRRHRIGAHHAREAAHLLARHRVPLVRHR